MAEYTIGEAAERSGFTPSTLRYYESIELVVPSGRTHAGYRLYDDAALARLDFIARAKHLGCSLDEIRDLVAIWDGQRCDPVQHRFHELVTAKLAETRHHIDELTAFIRQLETAASHLARPASDGPCDNGCACSTAATTSPRKPAPIRLQRKPNPISEPVIACTLPAGAIAERRNQWRERLADARERTTSASGILRIDFDETADPIELARLVVAEQQCCAFFSFNITIDQRGVGLEIDAPGDTTALVSELFGSEERVLSDAELVR